jgi:Type II secretion system (T2SS), protein M subtype b
MKLRLTPLMSRVLAISLTAAAAGLCYQVLLAPFVAEAALQSDQLALLKRQSNKLESIAAAAPRYEAIMKRLAANPELSKLSFQAPQASIAVAQLQSQFGQLVSSAGATILSSQAMPEVAEQGLTKISVGVTFQAEIKSLMKVLDGLDRARPLHFLEKLNIRDPDGEWAGQAQPGKPEGNKLQVELVVTAYMRQ